MDLSSIFRPLSAEAFRRDAGYTELLPSPALRPFVHCFWGTAGTQPVHSEGGLVIPDLCMDLIFTVNYTENQIHSALCALDDRYYFTSPAHSNALCATFGIRFFAWTFSCFAQDSPANTLRGVFPPGMFLDCICREIELRLFDLDTLASRADFAESVLMRCLHAERMNADVCNAIYAMVRSCGRIKLRDCASASCLSERQLERIFHQTLGAPPKLINQLVRHQMVFRDLVEGRYHPLDAVSRYGYADQSHLIRDFRRFHGLSPQEVLLRLKR